MAAITPTSDAALPQARTGPLVDPANEIRDGLAPQDVRRLRLAWAAGAVPVVIGFAWLIMAGSWSPLQHQYFDDFYDHQARAFLDGRWDVPRDAVGFEGFLIDGKTYIYFGPGPALLRLPVLAATDRLDGQLTTVSMMVAMVVLVVAAHRLSVTVRTIVRGAAPVGRREVIATAGLAVAVLAGPPLWLASVATVFHEAILWGLAFAVAALDAAGRWVLRPTAVRLVVVVVAATGAVLSRQTLGMGVLTGLWLLVAVALAGRALRRHNPRAGGLAPPVALGPLTLACTIVTVAMVLPNLAKFGEPFAPPMQHHIASMQFGDRKAFLEANHGEYFGPQFVPTTLLQFTRPDAFDLRPDFPWIDFPAAGPTVVGDVTFDHLEWTSSVPVTMTALVVLALPGVAWLVVAVRRRRPDGVALLALWAGTWIGAVGAIAIGYVAHRYVGDLVPIVLLPALVGAHWLLGRRPAGRGKTLRRVVPVGLGVLVLLGAWVNLALGIEYQRERGFNIPEEWRAQLVRWRADLPGGRPPILIVPAGQVELPDARDRSLAVLGDCDGLYLRVGDDWRGVARGPAAGLYDLRVDTDALRELAPGERAPLITLGSGNDATVVAMTRLPSGEVRVDFDDPLTDGWSEGDPADLHGRQTVRVITDPRAADRDIRIGRVYLNRPPTADPAAAVTVGRLPDGVARTGLVNRYPGAVSLEPFDSSLCRDTTGIG
jgi:hypothetical protein